MQFAQLKKTLPLILIAFLLLLSAVSIAVAEVRPHEFAAANVDALNVRKKPGGDILRKLSMGENVYVLDVVEKDGKNWAYVCLIKDQYGKAGYVDTRYLDGLHDSWNRIRRIACGSQHAIALDDAGTVFYMGEAVWDERSMNGLRNQADISSGGSYSAAIAENGNLTLSTDAIMRDHAQAWPPLADIFNNIGDAFSAMDAEGRLYTTQTTDSLEVLSLPETWKNARELSTTHGLAAMVDTENVLHTLLLDDGWRPNAARLAIMEADGLTGVRDAIVCGRETLVLLMQDGTVRVVGNNAVLSAVESWKNIRAINGNTSYVVGVTDGGAVRMAGYMPRIDMNTTHTSTEGRINFEEDGTLSRFTDIVSAACSDRILLLLHADGTVDMLSGMYYTP